MMLLSSLILLGNAFATQVDDPRTWQFRTPMPTPRTGVAAVVLDAKVYVIGGKDAGGNVVQVVERFDPVTNTWDTQPALNNARFNAAAVISGNRILVTGGSGANGLALDLVEIYDPGTMRWSNMGNMLAHREGHTAVVIDNTVYVSGGSDENEQILNTVEYYDDSGNLWRDFPSWDFQVGKASFASAVVADSAYSFGGFSSFGPLSLVQRYHSSSGIIEKAPMDPARGGLFATAFEDAIYVAGGRMGNNEVIDTVNRFFPADNRWDFVDPLIDARENAAAVSVNDQIIVLGGNDAQGNVLGSVEVFDTVSLPIAVNDTETTAEDTPILINVLNNDSDPANSLISISGFTQGTNGSVSLAAGNTLSYDPQPNFNGIDLFSYTIQNIAGGTALATVQITVTPENDPPAFDSTPDTGAVINATYTYAISVSDVDSDPLSITSGDLPAWLQLIDGGDKTALLSGMPGEADIGLYDIEISVSDGEITVVQFFELTVVGDLPSKPILLLPANGTSPGETTIAFTWQGDSGVTFQFQLSTEADFSSTLVDTLVTNSTLNIQDVREGAFFWRVRASNAAGASDWSLIYSFMRSVAASTENELPLRNFKLLPAYPNPFRGQTTISFELEHAGQHAELSIFDLTGRHVITLLYGTITAGMHELQWNGRDTNGRALSSSAYIVHLRVGEELKTRLLTRIR